MARAVLLLPIVLLTACAAGGGGDHASAGSSPATTAAPETTPAPSVLRLAVVGLRTTPTGPTTAQAIAVHFAITNCGTAATPYEHDAKGFTYTPIAWVLERDGVRVFAGSVGGLMPGDTAPITVQLPDEPPGDKTYQVRLDPHAQLPLSDREGTTQSVTLTFGGSG